MNITKIHKAWVACFLFAVTLFVSGCSTIPDTQTRVSEAQNLFAIRGFETTYYDHIFTASKITQPTKMTRIYIEGDGFAYITPVQPSPDPTPLKPMFAALATQDPAANVIYIGRPCQYGHTTCVMADWTTDRFSQKNMNKISDTIQTLQQKHNLHELELVGYSGGAYFATILAAQRCDVIGLRSLGGNLNVTAFTELHQIDTLRTSGDALMRLHALREVPQLHLVSRDDTIIPPQLVQGYIDQLNSPLARAVVVDDPTHGDGWADIWAGFINQSLPAKAVRTCIP
jgi:pimeloyl-ACP methyl ester carboxylesterase